MAMFDLGRLPHLPAGATGMEGTPGKFGKKLYATSGAVTGRGIVTLVNVDVIDNAVVSAVTTTTLPLYVASVIALNQGAATTAATVSVEVVSERATTNQISTTAVTVQVMAITERREFR